LSFIFGQRQRNTIEFIITHNRLMVASAAQHLTAQTTAEGGRNLNFCLFAPNRYPACVALYLWQLISHDVIFLKNFGVQKMQKNSSNARGISNSCPPWISIGNTTGNFSILQLQNHKKKSFKSKNLQETPQNSFLGWILMKFRFFWVWSWILFL
jgi:hypothetical protein